MRFHGLVCFVLILAVMISTSSFVSGDDRKLPRLPDKEGFAGSFCGTSAGVLLVAGGANFPDKKPWEGGKKVWYDTIYVLEKPNGSWKLAGRLPRRLGYGVSVSDSHGVICVGGSDADRHHSDVFRLEWNGEKITRTELPPLPRPLANMCGVIVGSVLYVAGGQEQPDSKSASKQVLSLDLTRSSAKWESIDSFPGSPRILAMAATLNDRFYVMGGAELIEAKDGRIERRYLKDMYGFDPKRGWEKLSDLPAPIAAAPSPCPSNRYGFVVLGGDDGTQILKTPDQHPGFRSSMLHYDSRSNRWREIGKLSAPRVTTGVVPWNLGWVIPSGEVRPGIRSPEVWQIDMPVKE